MRVVQRLKLPPIYAAAFVPVARLLWTRQQSPRYFNDISVRSFISIGVADRIRSSAMWLLRKVLGRPAHEPGRLSLQVHDVSLAEIGNVRGCARSGARSRDRSLS